jgi:hypothetical protein
MGTNQDWWSCSDGSTVFFYYTAGGALHDYSGSETSSPRYRDGIHGLKLFYQSRGYSVNDNYNQYIMGHNGNTTGFTYDNYKTCINNGIPVLIHLSGHTMVGIGYESTNSTIYILNTWDYDIHSMTWGGTYSDAQHVGASVLQLNAPTMYTISGTILNSAAAPIPGVTVRYDSQNFTTTAANGTYSIQVPWWWTGTMTPSLTGYTFNPPTRSYSNVAANSTSQNYTGNNGPAIPANVAITKTSTQLKISWDVVTGATHHVYGYDNPTTSTSTDVSAQGTFTTASGRVTWTTTLPSALRKFYRVTSITAK